MCACPLLGSPLSVALPCRYFNRKKVVGFYRSSLVPLHVVRFVVFAVGRDGVVERRNGSGGIVKNTNYSFFFSFLRKKVIATKHEQQQQQSEGVIIHLGRGCASFMQRCDCVFFIQHHPAWTFQFLGRKLFFICVIDCECFVALKVESLFLYEFSFIFTFLQELLVLVRTSCR